MQNIYKFKLGKFFSFFNIEKTYGKKILTYHSLNKKKNKLTSGIYQLDPNIFHTHVNYLKNNNTKFKNLEELLLSDDGILISFDDGYKNFISNAFEIILKYNISTIIFLCPKFIQENNKNYLNKKDLKEISKFSNIEIGSHSYDHVDLTKLKNKDLEYQLKKSKEWLENNISKKVNKISYPYGRYNLNVINKVKKLKYDYGFTTRFDFYNNNYSDYQIPRIDIWDHDQIDTFSMKIKGKWNWMKYLSK